MLRTDENGSVYTIEETIRVHHEEVFSCLTTSTGLVRWMCLSAEIETRAGGLVTFGWDAGMDRRTTVAILEYDAGGRITWDWFAGPEDRHAPVAWTVTPVTEPGAEGTKVTIEQGPFEDTRDGAVRLAYEVDAWRWRLCNLRSVLEVKHDMRRERPL